MSETRTEVPRPRVLWIPLLLLPLLVPIATTNVTVLGIDAALGVDTLKAIKSAIAALLALAALAGWYGSVARRERTIRWDPALWCMSGVLGLATISTLASLDPWYALFGSYQYRQGLFMLLLFGAMLFLIVQAVRDAKGMRWLALAVVIGGVPVAMYALVQVAGFDLGRWGAPAWALARGFATLGNPDNLGGYLIFPTTLALGLALGEKRLAFRYALWGAFGLSAISLLMTQVRGAWLGMLISAVALFVFAARTKLRLKKEDWIALGIVLVLLLGTGVSAGDSIARRVGDMFSGDRDAGSGRIALWETGVRTAIAHPLLGVGPDSFRLGHYEARSSSHEELGGYATIADDAHNLPIMIAATLGVPALLLAILFLYLVVRRSGARAFARRISSAGAPSSRMIYAAWLAAVLGHVAYLLFGPSSITTSLLLVIGFGVLVAVDARPVAVPSQGPLAGSSAVLIIVSAIVLYTGAATVVAEYHYIRTYVDDLAVARTHAEEAVSAAPWLYQYRAREAWLTGRAAVASTAVNAEETEREAVVAYKDLAYFAPAEYLTYVEFARTLLSLPSAGEETDALAAEVSELGVNIYPNGLEARMLGAEAYVRLEAYEKAITLLEAEWDSDPAYAQPGVAYAYALLGAGRTDEALDVVESLRVRFPDDASVVQLVEIAEEIREGG